MVTCLPKLQMENDGNCRGCALGKNTKGYFLSSDSRSKGILVLVRSDVCVSMTIHSLSAYLYYVILIDEYSQKNWIYFMETNDEVYNIVKEFRYLVENLIGRHVRVLRTNNGG